MKALHTFGYISLSLVLLLGTLTLTPTPAKAQPKEHIEDLRIIVTLLDYVSKDYQMAVKDGAIIDDAEYEEQIDFVKRCISLHQEISSQVKHPRFSQQLPLLYRLLADIERKVKVDQVSKQALAIKNNLLDLGILKTSPDKWPLISDGKTLYQANCASCHGTNGYGDGPLAKGLEPEPASFQDNEAMNLLSPLQAYNVIKLGVDGTAMTSYDAVLSEQEIWSLAFYIMSMRYDTGQAVKKIPEQLSLDHVTKFSDRDLKNYLSDHFVNLSVAAIRTHIPDRPQPLTVAKTYLDLSYQSFLDGNTKQAEREALHSYLEGIELVENMLPRLMVRDIESNMIHYRNAIKDNHKQQAETYYYRLAEQISEADSYLSEIDYSFAFIYGASLSVLLRESLEALFIILIVLSVLKPMNIPKAIRAVHLGWMLAVLLGFVSWFFVDALVGMSGASREVMEGVAALVAVVVLLYAGTWLHSHSEISKWTQFVKEKISSVSKSGSTIGLAVFSFIIVFREAFEVVLFLSSINLNATEASSSALLWALVTTIIFIALFAYLFQKTTKRLPVSKIFKASAFVISLLAVILAGKGIHALQEAGYVSVSLISWIPQIEILGVYPSVQVLLAQLAVIVILILFSIKDRKSTAFVD